MQPNNQQGYYRPEATQPVQPVAPLQSSPVVGQSYPTVDPAALNAALAEPVATPQQPEQPIQSAPEALGDTIQSDGYESTQEEFYDDMDTEEPVTWSAQEFLHQEKGGGWFALFGVIIAALLGLSIWTQAWTFAVLIVVITILIIVYSRRPPRELTYSLTGEGLLIDGRLHEFGNFKAFGVVRDGDQFSVVLIPVQRFQPGVSVYFPEESGEAIVDTLGARLPMKELKLDAVDKLVRLLRL